MKTCRFLQYILLLALAAASLPAQAALYRNSDGYYLIGTPEEYVELTNSPNLWGSKILQIYDIDLGGRVVTPIGNKTVPFSGTYDGMGHSLSNAVMYWDEVSIIAGVSYNYFGLFGCIHSKSKDVTKMASVCNLTIEGVTMTRTIEGKKPLSDGEDIKVGVLAGVVSQNSIIHDIAVVNCHINDRIPGETFNTQVRGLMLGGVIGEITVGPDAYSATNNPNFSLRNIYCKADIDLSNTRTGNGTEPQMFAGGLIGRIRYPVGLNFIPENCIYTGTIIFPRGLVSPTVGNMRTTSGNTMSTQVRTYAGEMHRSGTDVIILSQHPELTESLYFYDYKAYNSSSTAANKIESVTGSYPPVQDPNYGTRTFMDNSTALSVNNNNYSQWAKVQGVNFGNFLDTADDAAVQAVIDRFNSTITNPDYSWSWDSTAKRPVLSSSRSIYQDASIEIDNSDDETQYVANIYYRNSLYPLSADNSTDVTYQWESAVNLADADPWRQTSLTTQSITFDPKFYYRVHVTIVDNGVTYTYTSKYRAPNLNVYVYNKELTDWYRSNFKDLPGSTPEHPVADFSFLDSLPADLDGDDANDGLSPERPVRTLAAAYDRLGSYGYTNSNRIIVMGYLEDHDFLIDRIPLGELATSMDAKYCKPATITGTDRALVKNGIFSLFSINNTDHQLFMQAPLRFDNIELSASMRPGNKATAYFIYCQYNDITFDDNVLITNFPYMTSSNKLGLPEDIRSLPYFNIVLGMFNYNTTDPILYPSDIFPDRPNYYAEPGRINAVFRSGCFARLICASRNSGGGSPASHNIASKWDVPSRARVVVNIPDDINHSSEGVKRTFSKYGFTVEGTAGSYHYVPCYYSHNFGLISGGQTDGSVFCDTEINLYAGAFARVITGNISYGRNPNSPNDTVLYPADSFWGRTRVNIHGKTKIVDVIDAKGNLTYDIITDTHVNEIYGGILGRCDGNDSENKPFFYGESELNIYGGFIGRYRGDINPNIAKDNDLKNILQRLVNLKSIEPSIYAAGAGGVAGLGTKEFHTVDKSIPYLDAAGNFSYGDFDTVTLEGNHMPVMKMYDGTLIDLSKTNCSINIYSGVIEGSVYGGGLGYTNNLVASDYQKVAGYSDGNPQTGLLFGNSQVTMLRSSEYEPPLVMGNVYGGCAGDSRYADAWRNAHPTATTPNPFSHVASQYGNCDLTLLSGTIGNRYENRNDNISGNVYGGSRGVPGYEGIGATYGRTNLLIDGVTVYGNVFGGSSMANIHKRTVTDPTGASVTEDGTGNTNLVIRSGVIGNNIFGGSEGTLADGTNPATKAIIEGDTHVTIEGGEFINTPYINLNRTTPYADTPGNTINLLNSPERFRTFNIYGGGYLNCDVQGTAYLRISSSLMVHDESFVDARDNPNAIDRYTSDFQKAYMDETFRRFCVYGGGYGENTNVLNTDVYVTIPRDRPGVTRPHGYTLTSFLKNQSFFDISGGGYSGSIGYWNDDYTEYIGGQCKLLIDDYVFARKIVGGGFYGSCRSTNTYVRCGSLRQVYGGSLLGYVHDKVLLQFGNRTEDFIATRVNPDNTISYINMGLDELPEGYERFNGNLDGVDPQVWQEAQNRAKSYNDYIFITENIYGGNDIKGIIGTTRYVDANGNPAVDATDGAPLWQTDINPSELKGIVFNIYGGTFMGDVFGAGNGHYRGYYVPDWLRYEDGPDRMYTTVRSSIPRRDANGNITNYLRDADGNIVKDDKDREVYTGKVYRSRPMVGSVNVNLRGNSENDYVHLVSNFFGGGRECTLGQWNTFLPVEDPTRLLRGGHLHVNFGGFVHVDGNVYLGSEGRLYGEQALIPTTDWQGNPLNIDLSTFDGSTTRELTKLDEAAYGHWYFDEDDGYYKPGFPAPGKVDGNYGMTGEHMMRGYIKNIEMEGDVELTFYRLLYERNENGYYKYHKNDDGTDLLDAMGQRIRIRKHWVPGEIALATPDATTDNIRYDAEDIKMNSFFLGGLCGSMTNNKVMIYDYDTNTYFDEDEAAATQGSDRESWGAVYRVALPSGVTIRENVVLGSQNACIKYYPYSDQTHTALKTVNIDGRDVQADPYYTYNGGMVTHSAYTFDLIVYNNLHNFDAPLRNLPDDFYDETSATNPDFLYNGVHIKDIDNFTIVNGSLADVVVYRRPYDTTKYHGFANMSTNMSSSSLSINDKRFALAVTFADDDPNHLAPLAHIGRREARRVSGISSSDPLTRNKQTMAKLTAACVFDPLVDPTASDPDSYAARYGGNIYGGCYNSGTVIGDVVLNISSDLLGGLYDNSDSETFNRWSSLKYNIGRVFGGGYGADTSIDGDTYINLLRQFRGMNVFGGGMEGDVTGTPHILYIGDETISYIFGGIYGGGLRGSVGTEHLTEFSTDVRLYSGNVNNVYGGSCMGNLFGRTFVEVCDHAENELSHLNYNKMVTTGLVKDWNGSRLIAGNVYAGNDIAGIINPYDPAGGSSVPGTPSTDQITDFGRGYTTSLLVHEVQGDIPAGGTTAPGKESPGNNNGYNGFPLVANLYGGSNSDYGEHGTDGKYLSGSVELATGNGSDFLTVPLGYDPVTGRAAYDIPNVDKAIVHLHGGTIINAYGGGNMSTITDELLIDVDYPAEALDSRAGFEHRTELDRLWSVFGLSADEQQSEVSTSPANSDVTTFTHHIYHLFGGNNNADMAIQPGWQLKRAVVSSLYSGSNYGKMTVNGLSLTIDSDDMYVDYVYGGGRIGDIAPTLPIDETTGLPITPSPDFYGATLNIERGIINHVYGGNDVSGYVHYGTNVNIHGAVSGDVYCAGNGNYYYKYDRDASLFDYSDPSSLRVREAYDLKDEFRGLTNARYFILPATADYGFNASAWVDASSSGYEATDAMTLLAINSYRPNVERSRLHVAGRSESDKVWIRGNLYCGGNSSTVVPRPDAPAYDVQFDIDDHVVINGVYLGSNGAELADGLMIQATESLNSINFETDNNLTPADLTEGRIRQSDAPVVRDTGMDEVDDIYPSMLDLYMRAVEIVNTPHDFDWDPDLKDAFIGDFCVGGNRGSMMIDRKIALTFPTNLTVFGSIIGGCRNANVKYGEAEHIGGLLKPLAPDETVKVDLKIRSCFRPLSLLYPDTEANPPISLNDFMVDADLNPIDPSDTSTKRFYYPGQCNIYGGCFESGKTVGGINLDIQSDMLRYNDTDCVDKQAVINGLMDPRSLRSFTVVGAGYGADTHVWGDVNIRFLPHVIEAADLEPRRIVHPSAATVFGGSQEGLVVGNTKVEIRDGHILANLYGASEAAKMYGSTAVIVGYPEYYTPRQSAVYRIQRADRHSAVSRNMYRDSSDDFVVPKTVAYHTGDIVPGYMSHMINGKVKPEVSRFTPFKLGQDVTDAQCTDIITPDNFENFFIPIKTVPSDLSEVCGGALTWDDIDISVGDQASNHDPNAPYYGQGNIYGGGYIPGSSKQDLTGENTVLRYNKKYHPEADHDQYQTNLDEGNLADGGFGGNSTVLIWDNHDNARRDDSGNYLTRAADGSAIRDHVHIGTGRFVKETTPERSLSMGLPLFYNVNEGNALEPSYKAFAGDKPLAGVTYYTKSADGGVYGGGRKVFVEAFRAVDIAYYGYAEHTPQSPKLLNTIQRSDLVSVTDCCMDLVGASDFAVDRSTTSSTVVHSDNTLFAINRVGELVMTSSLDPDKDLVPGVISTDTSNDMYGLMVHDTPRMRNYIALYRNVNFLGALSSNWAFDSKYHRGTATPESGDTTTHTAGTITVEHSDDAHANQGLASYISHKHDITVLYHAYRTYGKSEMTDNDKRTLIAAYNVYRNAHTDEALTEYTDKYTGSDGSTTVLDITDVINAVTRLFDRRNVGMSGNMIGISSGYSLYIEGIHGNGTNYFGPVYGVTEIKLLTLVVGRGGGYVYALNHHYDTDPDLADNWCDNYGHDFLMTTGNFVFPGAAYYMTDDENNAESGAYSYIIDDCCPINYSYYDYLTRFENDENTTAASQFNVNNMEEGHYWYINGRQFCYNLTLTAITNDDPEDFYLNNNNDMLMLSHINKDTNVRITEVNWFAHPEDDIPADQECDITGYNLERNYRLFFTLGDDTRTLLAPGDDNPDGYYAAEIPRADYAIRLDGENVIYDNYTTGTAAPVDPNAANNLHFAGEYNTATATWTKMPNLGIRLHDEQKNRFKDQTPDVGREYFENHLKAPHMVQVVIEADNGSGSPVYEYVINLTIQYLLGPMLVGNVNIENCALPGEYIYANANDVYLDMDEQDLSAVDPYWRIYPNDEHGHRLDADGNTLDRDGFIVDDDGNFVLDSNNDKQRSTPLFFNLFDAEHRQTYAFLSSDPVVGSALPEIVDTKSVHIPAYWYQSGWELTYGVNVGKYNFETYLPFAAEVAVDPDDPTAGTRMQPIEGNRLLVHNYHRMRPRYDVGGKPLDQRLVAGARVYIEDDTDMEYFFDYLTHHQFTDGGKTSDAVSLTGQAIGPQYAEGINFIQVKDVKIPNHGMTPITFKGTYHGYGHRLLIPEGTSLNLTNAGSIHNVGFVSYIDDNNTKVFADNQGSLHNCYYYNVYGKGSFLGAGNIDIAPGHQLVNNYENTLTTAELTDKGYSFDQVMHLSSEGFHYGQAAYNLNSYYLQMRHRLLHWGDGADNNTKALSDRYNAMRNTSEYDSYRIDYVDDLYRDGEYRYAYAEVPDQTHLTHATALRTLDVPNYFDRLSRRSIGGTSMHVYTHDIDTERWDADSREYHPNFDSDFIFYGENLQADTIKAFNALPSSYSEATRVYRIGGFYGSGSDKGAFVNRVGYISSNVMTAVDYVGYRDRDMYGADGKLIPEYKLALDGPTSTSDLTAGTGWIIREVNRPDGSTHRTHEVFMPPTMDVPWTWDSDGSNIRHDFRGFDIDTTRVTHNLLVYTAEWDEAMSVMSKFDYSAPIISQIGLGRDYNVMANHDQWQIIGHHILDRPQSDGGPEIRGGYFHLVDNHDFNAPVAFRANQAWYARDPADYADEYSDLAGYQYKTAWEGICLPYDVMMTYAASRDINNMPDVGEITHFFTADASDTDNNTGHEYWLRRYVDSPEADKLAFERPTHTNQAANEDLQTDYIWNNSTFHDLYKQYGYDESGVSSVDGVPYTHDRLYHDADGTLERTIAGYRHMSNGVPYIVTFPGERYYEFDLSGNFYYNWNSKNMDNPIRQRIAYFAKGDNDASTYVTIPVTDDRAIVEYTKNGYTFTGTYVHVTNDTELSKNVLYDYRPHMAVLDASLPKATDPTKRTVHLGENFSPAEQFTADGAQGKVVVMPFHTYVYASSPITLAKRITAPGRAIIDDDDPEQEEIVIPDTDDDTPAGIEVWTEGSVLMIRTPEAFETTIYDFAGRSIRRIRAYEGVNRYSGLLPGFYIVCRTKIHI